jgi:hypothetical protein
MGQTEITPVRQRLRRPADLRQRLRGMDGFQQEVEIVGGQGIPRRELCQMPGPKASGH